ncbi:MAG: hypothetical protein U0X91_02075 [Spirosomataceae bacterium]
METIEIEGVITEEFDNEGFVKMFFTNSDSGKHIWVNAGNGIDGRPVVDMTDPVINPIYPPKVGAISVIKINKAGFFKRSSEDEAEPITTFIEQIRDIKANTASPTTTFQVLGG